MTAVERYYDNGRITIQIDYLSTRNKYSDLLYCDRYDIPIKDETELNIYLASFCEPFKRLQDLK